MVVWRGRFGGIGLDWSTSYSEINSQTPKTKNQNQPVSQKTLIHTINFIFSFSPKSIYICPSPDVRNPKIEQYRPPPPTQCEIRSVGEV